MNRSIVKWAALLMASACGGLNGADMPATARTSSAGLPTRVVEKTREQLLSYLGTTQVKWVPLLDPAVDWHLQAHWPDRFAYQGRQYELQITELREDGPTHVRNRAAINPRLTTLFWYKLDTTGTKTAVTNAIFPQASWSLGDRVPDKLLFWGSKDFGGVRKTVFDYEFYPEGQLHEFHWESRVGDEAPREVFDWVGNLVGRKTSNGCVWNGLKVSQEQFLTLSRNLKRSGGSTSQTPVTPGAPRRAPAPRR